MSVPIDPEAAASLHRDIKVLGLQVPGPLPLRPPGAFGPDDKGDPAYWMLLDGHVTVPVVHSDSCYICRDPEYAAMGLPLCYPCPACVRRMRPCGACSGRGGTAGEACSDCLATGFTGGMGHIPADDEACDECEFRHGPDDYDENGLITGIPPELAQAIKDARHPRSR